MSDSYERVVDIQVSAEDAPALGAQVVKRLRKLGLITGRLNERCVLGGKGYLPGPALAKLYQRAPREGKFWEMVTCGVKPITGWHFNEWALGEALDGFVCPACQVEVGPLDEEFREAVFEKVGECLKKSGPGFVACPICRKKNGLTNWICRPPLGFGNLSFSFWNWPPLDWDSWKIDVPGIIRETTGHQVVTTYGRI